ncbi:hypothetical protein GCM10007938_02190 [Vibrio zhanjiangensis]|uniref:Uncharacterized protein n=1 Tax=Vibrio zhanjiangensis TaxID=1046128 RepID=A0ABQ6ETG3_9VIBR|nr:hypothetical protein [Vibrio zhanjiangensis]GLT16443.1 hypothetical protein GCM10007938_02190 [Vibrio zhanjiangensis]
MNSITNPQAVEFIRKYAPITNQVIFDDKSPFYNELIRVIRKNLCIDSRSERKVIKVFEQRILDDPDGVLLASCEEDIRDYKKNQIRRKIKNKISIRLQKKYMAMLIRQSVISTNYFYIILCLVIVIVGAFYLDKSVLALVSAISGGVINSLINERNSI